MKNQNKISYSAMMQRFIQTLLLCVVALTSINASAVERVTYYHNDALGSPVAATDKDGNLLWREEYEPYGERILREDADSNTLWFTGKQEETAFGINYFGARWYDPTIGRFMAVDPAGFNNDKIQSFNRYAYANNNPYFYVDPDGNFGVPGFVIGAGIELGAQLLTSGKINNPNAILVAGIVGAVTGGIAGKLATNAAKGLITSSQAVARTAATSGIASATGSVTTNLLNGESPNVKDALISGAAGAAGGYIGAKFSNSATATIEKIAKSNVPGAQNVAQTTKSAIIGEVSAKAETLTSGFQKAATVGANLGLSGIQKSFEKKTE